MPADLNFLRKPSCLCRAISVCCFSLSKSASAIKQNAADIADRALSCRDDHWTRDGFRNLFTCVPIDPLKLLSLLDCRDLVEAEDVECFLNSCWDYRKFSHFAAQCANLGAYIEGGGSSWTFPLEFSLVQDGISALRNAHMRSILSLRSFPNVVFEMVPAFI